MLLSQAKYKASLCSEIMKSSATIKTNKKVYNYFEGGYSNAGIGLFSQALSDKTRGKGFMLQQGRISLGIRKKGL